MDKVIIIRSLLVPIGPAWDNRQAHIPKGTVFNVESELEDRIIAYNSDYRIALFSDDYSLLNKV